MILLNSHSSNESRDTTDGIVPDKPSYLDPLRGPRVSGEEGFSEPDRLHELVNLDDKLSSCHSVIGCLLDPCLSLSI